VANDAIIILHQHKSPSDKTIIGYDHKHKDIEEEKSFKLPRKTEEIPKSHTNGSKDSNNRLKDHDQSRHDKQASQRPPFQRRPFAPRYQSLFPGYCFSCNNFGHKAIDCRDCARNTQVMNRGIYNNVECYKFHNYGHITRDCRSMMDSSMKENAHIKYKKVWRRKKKQEEHVNGEFSEDIPTGVAKMSNNDKYASKEEDVRITNDDPATEQHYTLFKTIWQPSQKIEVGSTNYWGHNYYKYMI
jgi:hypothetical protein